MDLPDLHVEMWYLPCALAPNIFFRQYMQKCQQLISVRGWGMKGNYYQENKFGLAGKILWIYKLHGMTKSDKKQISIRD